MAPPPGSAPAPLAPSVEEAYKRKCQQLKRRMNEVEDSNEAAYVRVTRLRREIEKIRLERVFLLDQLTRRTSTNVEDSDGSPSPPSTPKEKPLRTKRGHRKPDLNQSINTSIAQPGPGGLSNLSPTSDSFSQAPESQSRSQPVATTSSIATEHPFLNDRKPVTSGFDVYYNTRLPSLRRRVLAGELDDKEEADIQDSISEEWDDLTPTERKKHEETFEKQKPHLENGHRKDAAPASSKADEDVEMADDNAGV